MSTIGDFLKDLQDRQAEAMKQYQDMVSESMQAFQGGFGGAAGGTDSDAGAMFPDPAKVADSYYNFASELLKQQHEFTLKLIEVMKPAKSS
jgi:hypothetical protein